MMTFPVLTPAVVVSDTVVAGFKATAEVAVVVTTQEALEASVVPQVEVGAENAVPVRVSELTPRETEPVLLRVAVHVTNVPVWAGTGVQVKALSSATGVGAALACNETGRSTEAGRPVVAKVMLPA